MSEEDIQFLMRFADGLDYNHEWNRIQLFYKCRKYGFCYSVMYSNDVFLLFWSILRKQIMNDTYLFVTYLRFYVL